jgi:hypothetical protein
MSLHFCIQKIESTDVGFSYSGFNDFRHRIARSIGLKDVYSWANGTREQKTDMYLSGRYKEIESSHPIYPLIEHNDNEGDLGPDDCGQVGAYLKTLIPEWEKELDQEYDKELEHDIEMGKKLADLMMQCHENNETLMFL